MKNSKKIIILVSTFLFLTGCVSTKVYNFERYLKHNNYVCIENICTMTERMSDNIEKSKEYNINEDKYIEVTDYGIGNQKSTLTYNYETNLVAFNYVIANITFSATYNVDKEEFKCGSDDNDKIFESAQCESIKEEIIETIETVKKDLKESEYKK